MPNVSWRGTVGADYFRVLKSGCKELENRTAERRAAAWRIRIRRELPELPPEILFSDIELRVLALFAKSCRAAPPKNPGDAVFLVARLGGYAQAGPARRASDRLRPTRRNGFSPGTSGLLAESSCGAQAGLGPVHAIASWWAPR